MNFAPKTEIVLTISLCLFLNFFVFKLSAQVGIGNTDPHSSSMLDITSDDSGLLIPRMTSLQRQAIDTPANSLLVFDTDESAYFYYDESTASWIKINSSKDYRDNYVLVKSEADFPAPSGGVITLDTDTLYEINGTIVITSPINFNDAYIAGLDASEDVLVRTSGDLFVGNSGGSIKNITIAGGGTVFNITGGASLLIQNTIITGMGSVGSISNVNLFFSNIIQFLGNTTGVTYSNIDKLLLSNQGWFGNNSGVYETLTGTFGLVQKVSGFSEVNGTAVGFNVSSNPTVGEGILLSTLFSGTGTYVNRYTTGSYTGFNFNNNWTVECPGLPVEKDAVAIGDINLNAPVGSGATTTFSGTGTGSRTKILGTTTSNNLFRFTNGGVNNRLVYRGNKTRYFQVTGSISYQASADNTIIVYIARNGTVIEQIRVYGRGASGFFVTDAGILALSVVGTIQLSTNDYIEVWAERHSGSGTISTVSLNLTVK